MFLVLILVDLEEICYIEIYVFYIILIKDFVYKIKKNVKYNFLNYFFFEWRWKVCVKEFCLNWCIVLVFYLVVVLIIIVKGVF